MPFYDEAMAKRPVWLDDEEQQTWRAFLAANAHLEEHLDRQLAQDSGLPHGYYQILAMLSETAERRMRMQDLACVVQSSQSRLSHAVSRLEEAGWVAREKAEKDKRGIYVALTDTGFSKLEATAPGHAAEVKRRLFAPLSTEQVVQLRAICEAITTAD